MSYQSMMQQAEEDHQLWGGNSTGWGTHRLKATEGSSFEHELDEGASSSGGGGGGDYRGGFGDPSTTVCSGNSSGFGADLTSVSAPELFSLSPRQPLQQNSSFPFSWQSLLGGGQQASVRWQPYNSFPGTTTEPRVAQAKFLNASALGEVNARRGEQNELSLAHERSAISEGEPDRVQENRTNTVNSAKENWRKSRDFMTGDVKVEESENIQEAGQIFGHEVKSTKRYRHSEPQGHHELNVVSFEPSASASQSGSDSEDSGKQYKKEVVSRKSKRPGHDADGNVTWTDESVRFLFETYDAIHQRLWEESKGQVKYQKKWTPILKAMQVRFGHHFTKKQCQSKYWSVRRECTEYRTTSVRAAATDPLWNPSIAGRELLKPKFYDVWFEVSGKNQAVVTKSRGCNVEGEGYRGEQLQQLQQQGEPLRVIDNDGQLMKRKVKSSSSAMKEMQRLMLVQLQASEKREEAMTYRTELMMDLLTQHIEHVENRVSIINESRTPQTSLLERVNQKLEKVLEGFTALNQNLSMLR